MNTYKVVLRGGRLIPTEINVEAEKFHWEPGQVCFYRGNDPVAYFPFGEVRYIVKLEKDDEKA